MFIPLFQKCIFGFARLLCLQLIHKKNTNLESHSCLKALLGVCHGSLCLCCAKEMNAYEKLVCCIPELMSAAHGSGYTVPAGIRKRRHVGPQEEEGALHSKAPHFCCWISVSCFNGQVMCRHETEVALAFLIGRMNQLFKQQTTQLTQLS